MLICVPTHKHAHTHRGEGRERFNQPKTEIFTKISIEFITGRARRSFSNKVMHDLIQTLEKADVGLLAAVLRHGARQDPLLRPRVQLRREAYQ